MQPSDNSVQPSDNPEDVQSQGKRKKRRAGFTTNKGHGEGKARRRMAKESRRRNRQR